MPAKLKPPPFPQIQKLHGVSRELHEIQQAISKATEPARKNPENEARIIEKVEILASGKVRVPHKLGRKAIGLTVVRVHSGDPKFTESDEPGRPARTSRFTHLAGTTAGIVDLKVW